MEQTIWTWVLSTFGVGGAIVYCFVKYLLPVLTKGRSEREEKHKGNTELILDKVKDTYLIAKETRATVIQLEKRFCDAVPRIENTEFAINEIRGEVAAQRKVCEDTRKEVFAKINIKETTPDPKKNGKATWRVLVVDDEVNITKMLREHLERQGYSVLTANRYDDAIDHISNEHFKWVLTDVVLDSMSGHSGYDIHELLYKKFPDTNCILFTGHSTNNLPEHIQRNFSAIKIVNKINLCENITKIMQS